MSTQRMKTWIGALAVVGASGLAPHIAGGQSAEDVLRASRLAAGLVVHLGVSDGQLELDLAKGGRLLVHGLSEDEVSLNKARRKLTEAGVYGVASVELWHPQPKLPYAADLINVLIADKALLARRGIEPAEIQRVLVPGGTAYLQNGNAWNASTKPWHKDLDDWTHCDYDCTNNPVSRDTRVGPVTTLKWIDGYRQGRGGRFLSWRGTLVHEMGALTSGAPNAREQLHLAVRDGFNGLPHYFLPFKSTSASGLQSTAVADGKIFTMANPQDPLGPMRAYDLATGQELLRFDEGGKLETPQQAGGSGHAYESGAPRWVRIVYDRGVLFQAANDSLVALDAKTGQRKWTYRDPDGNRLLFATVAPELGLVFVANTRRAEKPMPNVWGAWNSRWPGSPLAAVTALDAQAGRQAWRNEEVSGQVIGQLVYAEGRLAYFSPAGILAAAGEAGTGITDAWVGVLDAKTGKRKWSRNYYKNPVTPGQNVLGFAFNLALRGGKAYVANQNHIVEFDADTGEPLKHLALPTYNARCTRPRSTVKYHLVGFGSFVSEDLQTTVNQDISRGSCTVGPTPANGMTYLTPAHCHCFAMIRGWGGYGSEPLWEPLPVPRRLMAGPGAAPETIVDRVRRSEPAPTIHYQGKGAAAGGQKLRLTRLEGELVRNAWFGNDALPYPETEPVKSADLELVAVVNEHRVEARRGDRVAWSFVADGRISAPPLVHEGRVCVGAHDGWMSCLDLKDGRVLWRFLAAPNHRKIVAYGQLESSWPVYGAVVHEGLFAVSAGRHPELDGGIFFYGLDPATGHVRWSKRLSTAAEPVVAASGQTGQTQGKPRNWRQPANTIVNGPLSVSDGKLILVSPDETNEGIARPRERYQLVIAPRGEGQPTMPTRPNVKKTTPPNPKPAKVN